MELQDIERNWDAIFNCLPHNWKELSLETKALSVGSYVFSDPYVLMKAMLCYLMAGVSFETVATRLMSQGICKRSGGGRSNAVTRSEAKKVLREGEKLCRVW